MISQIYYKIMDYAKKFQLLKNPLIQIDMSAKVSFQKIMAKKGCTLKIGENSVIEGFIVFDKSNAQITIGNRTYIGGSSIISAEKIVIGNDILISWGCYVVDHNSHPANFSDRAMDVINWKLP